MDLPEMTGQEGACDLKLTAAKVLDKMDLAKEDIIAFTTDHDKVQQGAVSGFADHILSRACYAIHHTPGSVLPPARMKKRTSVAAHQSTPSSSFSTSDSQDTSDSDSSGNSAESATAPEAGEAANPEANFCPHEHERTYIQKELLPIFEKARKLAEWMRVEGPNIKATFEGLSEQMSLNQNRWNSQLDMLVFVLCNANAVENVRHEVWHKKRHPPACQVSPPRCSRHAHDSRAAPGVRPGVGGGCVYSCSPRSKKTSPSARYRWA